MRRPILLAVLLALLAPPATAGAYPPWRSTDADTAAPWSVEWRQGLLQYRRQGEREIYSTPLVRLNFGLPHHLEIPCELELRPVDNEVGEAAAGLKWIPLWPGRFSLGIEALLLLPVDAHGGAGVEAALLASCWSRHLALHLNGAGFYDGRVPGGEAGWKLGAVAEGRLGRLRPGVELFVKQVIGEEAEVLAGPGIIVDLGGVDVRTGLRLGLAPVWPLLETSFWVTIKIPLR